MEREQVGVMFEDILPRPTRSQPVVRIATAHIARFARYRLSGQILHLALAHNQAGRRVRSLDSEKRGVLHSALHWKLGTKAHV